MQMIYFINKKLVLTLKNHFLFGIHNSISVSLHNFFPEYFVSLIQVMESLFIC